MVQTLEGREIGRRWTAQFWFRPVSILVVLPEGARGVMGR